MRPRAKEDSLRLAQVTAFGREPRATGSEKDRRGVSCISEELALARFQNARIEHFLFSGPRV
eukprot:5669397-Pyramimonas_sp.AAC.1